MHESYVAHSVGYVHPAWESTLPRETQKETPSKQNEPDG